MNQSLSVGDEIRYESLDPSFREPHSAHIIGDKPVDVDLCIDFAFTDFDETWTMRIKCGVLNARKGASPETQLTVSGPKTALVGVAFETVAANAARRQRTITIEGDESVPDLRRLAARIRSQPR